MSGVPPVSIRHASQPGGGTPRLNGPERTSVPRATVTVLGLDGSTKTGRLVKPFLPASLDVVLDVTEGPETRRVVFAAERLSCVCFHVGGDPPRTAVGEKRVRVHLATGKTFVVTAPPADKVNPIGFFGTSTDANGPFSETFFYEHGVNAREEDAPIGKMLVDAGLAKPSEIERGLAAQVVHRNVPIGTILAERHGVPRAAIEDAARLQARKRLRIGEVLVEAGLATQAEVDAALAEQRSRKGKRLGDVLVEMQVVSEVDLAVTLAKKFHLPFVDLDQCLINEEATREVVSAELVEKLGVLPIDDDGKTLTIAISDPLATEVVDVLRFQTGRRITEVVATQTQLAKYVALRTSAAATGAAPLGIDGVLRDIHADHDQRANEEEERDASEVVVRGEDRGVIALVNQMVVDAVRRGASDIHIEPNGADEPVTVRFRVDGECLVVAQIPGRLRSALVSRIKIMARLDIAERRKPQDGKIRFRLGTKLVELRVATLPTVNGNEDVVMRVLASAKPLALEEMGFSGRNLRELHAVLAKPYGLVLCVGPTGSGKTTTLHSALGSINTLDTKIWTAEDPVEITQKGLRQVQVQSRGGFTFAAALRAFLRADPDVIMVGEMRDEETASIAVEASLTGHLVLSTLHTNSAPETITRLLDMGLDPFSFADALLGVMAQRLTRRLCPDCREHRKGTLEQHTDMVAHAGGPEGWERLGGPAFGPSFRVGTAVGCAACGGTGYRGRLALHELLVMTEALKHAVARRASVAEIRGLAVSGGMTSLLEDGILKCLAGLTDMRQVLAVATR